ncbi:glycerol-3-phosphate 1-O-acyltransferase PlsY [Alicyclobacillus vulcanalis]|uniref:Glycerol-3-phosphate acyltransferase n=1 Tax=Alicyclobacillus vulcanalis TaxID=252246 RepID=A0A1N7NC72_9BACL|nr:glycerol-3-phosphate 1-O-acyltransferase PlsY [Alicyclobacillus vulcanalis]SIS95993.1 glycerol-3-phosphate acyltransferase PlsY [Alicyclobacillus vulcanalis]
MAFVSLLSIVIAYLIGSISTSTLVVRWVSGRDIRALGSGNAGATNTMRTLGLKWGVLVLIFDGLKGAIALWIADALTPHAAWVLALTAVAVVVGHNWPLFFGFRGGKGIATTIGVLLWLAPLAAVIAGLVCLAVIALTRYVSLGSIVFVCLVPVFVAVFHFEGWTFAASIVLALLALYRHRSNIDRLLHGTERRIFDRTSEGV